MPLTFQKKKILIIEDELRMIMGLEDNLEYEGYTVISAQTGEEGLSLARQENPDLILLDVRLPGIDGIEVCMTLRKEKRHIPIIMLSVKNHEIDKVIGLETGADDYITKPFSLRELLARIKAVMRRVETPCNSDYYSFGNIEVFFQNHQVLKDGNVVEFTTKEFELLKYFICNKDVTLSREILLNNVWGLESFPTTRTVDTHIHKLRKKLEDTPDTPRHFITVHGVGYKFVD